MKSILLAGLLLPAACSLGYGQCDQKVLLTSHRTEHLSGDSTVEKSEDELTTIEFDKTSIKVVPGSNNTMSGKVLSHTCDWKTPFKEGKSLLKIALSDEHGETRNVTISIEGKNGQISFLARLDDESEDKRIKLYVDRFEEKK